MGEYSNEGQVNEEDLPPTIPLTCLIRVSTLVFAKITLFPPSNLHSMHISPLGMISHSNSSHKLNIIKNM